MNHFALRHPFPRQVACLALSDGSTWSLAAGDDLAHAMLLRLAEVMQAGHCDNPTRQLIVSVDDKDIRRFVLSYMDDGTIICQIGPAHNADVLAIQLTKIASVIAMSTEAMRGVLLHGALAELNGYSVILAGPGGVGKTTASQRFPPPWRSLCDDTTLVVCDKQGVYQTHPWPTWSKFMFGGAGGSWDVQYAVPLKGIFFLTQAQEDRVESIDAAEAICRFVQSTEQVSASIFRSLKEDETRAIRLRRFNNIWSLAQTVPCYRLHLSQTGEFWHEIERVINGGQE